MEGIQCAQFTFYNNFDSANLARVEYVPQNESVNTKNSNKEIHDAEFNIWTKPDCFGTEFENGNRTWFYFGMKAPASLLNVRFNMVDLNRQGKMYSQGMAPVYRVLPGKPKWDRVLDKPVHDQNGNIFTLTFKYRTPESSESVTYFAFTYPFSYTELEKMLLSVDNRFLSTKPLSEDDIYYVRETVCRSLEGRSIDLITISSHHGLTSEREAKLKNLFMDNAQRPFKFNGKKVIFVSARVHPGETPSTFVFNGLLNLLLNREDFAAQCLRRLYVFKMIPFLNPDGVARGHYRTDNRGVNLNRVYLNPIFSLHPSIYAARALLRYYHYGFEKDDVIVKCDSCKDNVESQTNSHFSKDDAALRKETISKKVSRITLEEGDVPNNAWCTTWHNFCRNCGSKLTHSKSKEEVKFEEVVVSNHGDVNSNESGLFAYIDLHGHASKKGVFMYGNHFGDTERNIECMLLPKLMSINNHHFHFNSCNFTERNMYLRDKRDGMSRAGSGRVAVLSLTGIIKSYTLECNYNTGRIVNVLPPTVKESNGRPHTLLFPPKYTPQIFEEVGRSLGSSILDMTGNNPCSRLPNSEFRTLGGLREWLHTISQELEGERGKRAKIRFPGAAAGGLRPQGKPPRVVKTRPAVPKVATRKHNSHMASVPLDRKENLAQPGCSKSGLQLNKCFKPKTHKDITLKAKNSSADKLKSKKPGVVPALKTAGREKLSKDAENLHLREIRFIKNSEVKTVIAKYDNAEFDESLVVSWESATNKSQVYTHKSRVCSAPPFGGKASEPGTSKRGAFRVHNFAKTSVLSRSKMKKHTLRRIPSAGDAVAKVDKKKKKIKMK